MSRKRRFYGLTALPAAINKPVKPTDVLLGGVVGLAGVGLMKYAMDWLSAQAAAKGFTIPDIVHDVAPAIGTSLLGAGLYATMKDKPWAGGVAFGAIAGGLAITGGGLAAKHQLPGFSGVVSVNLKGLVRRQLSGQHLGLVTGDPRRQSMGLIQTNGRPQTARKMGLVTGNRRAALSRVSGVRAD